MFYLLSHKKSAHWISLPSSYFPLLSAGNLFTVFQFLLKVKWARESISFFAFPPAWQYGPQTVWQMDERFITLWFENCLVGRVGTSEPWGRFKNAECHHVFVKITFHWCYVHSEPRHSHAYGFCYIIGHLFGQLWHAFRLSKPICYWSEKKSLFKGKQHILLY